MPKFGNPPSYAASAYALMDRIPDGATVATENYLAPHLISRTQVHLIGTGRTVDWTLASRDRLPDLSGTTPIHDIVFEGPLMLINHNSPRRNGEVCGGGFPGDIEYG